MCRVPGVGVGRDHGAGVGVGVPVHGGVHAAAGRGRRVRGAARAGAARAGARLTRHALYSNYTSLFEY